MIKDQNQILDSSYAGAGVHRDLNLQKNSEAHMVK